MWQGLKDLRLASTGPTVVQSLSAAVEWPPGRSGGVVAKGRWETRWEAGACPVGGRGVSGGGGSMEREHTGRLLTVQLSLASGPPAVTASSGPGPTEPPLVSDLGFHGMLWTSAPPCSSWLKELEGWRHSPVGEQAPGHGAHQDPGHEDGLGQGLQALVVTHQVPLEEKEAVTYWLRGQGLAGPRSWREVQVRGAQPGPACQPGS